jgi:hypothetical protein
MTDEFGELNRQIRELCEHIRSERDGERVVSLSAALEELFVRKDLIQQERNQAYRQHPRAS